MSVSNEPHFVISTNDVATWLERQGDEWWTVELDPIIGSRIPLPGPMERLAKFLRYLNRPMLILDRRPAPTGKGEVIGSDDLDELVSYIGDEHNLSAEARKQSLWTQSRFFDCSWPNSTDDWRLREDLDTTEMIRADERESVEEGV